MDDRIPRALTADDRVRADALRMVGSTRHPGRSRARRHDPLHLFSDVNDPGGAMPIFTIDGSDTYENLWDAGLARVIDAHADASVSVQGLDTPIVGTLAYVGRDRHLIIDQREGDSAVGTVVVVPLDRVVCVRAAYQIG